MVYLDSNSMKFFLPILICFLVSVSTPLYAADTASVIAGTLPVVMDGDSLPTLSDRLVDHNPMLILYTSGTTGMPKGAVLSGHNVMSNLDALARDTPAIDAQQANVSQH